MVTYSVGDVEVDDRVIRTEFQRFQDRIDGSRGVVDQNELFCIAMDVGGQRLSHCFHSLLNLPSVPTIGIGFGHLLVFSQLPMDILRGGAERAVIDIQIRAIQEEQI